MGKTVDCRGLACPRPVITAKKEIESIDNGDITVIVDNDGARLNLQKLAESMGHLSEVAEKEGLYYVTIYKTESCPIMDLDEKNLVIVVGTDKLGLGDDKLGSALMKSYMFALAESDVYPKTMVFLNSGVRLTTEGSDVLESLSTLEEKGVEMISCGTCLDFYNLKEKLKVGSISNMYTIVQKMNRSTNTINL